MKSFSKWGIVLALFGVLPTVVSTSAVTIAGVTFQDNAFADSVISSSGSFTTSGGTLADVLTDKNVGTYALSQDAGAYVELGFTDNALVNGPGPDLALFELGSPPDTFQIALSIGGQTINYTSAATGFLSILDAQHIYPINLAEVDLSDFGVAAGASLDKVVIGLSFQTQANATVSTVPSLSLVGALNTVPDSGSMLSLGAFSALAMLALSRLLPPRRI